MSELKINFWKRQAGSASVKRRSNSSNARQKSTPCETVLPTGKLNLMILIVSLIFSVRMIQKDSSYIRLVNADIVVAGHLRIYRMSLALIAM